jgi:phage tail sheath protein FI
MATDFLHGVEVVTVAGGPRPIQTIRSAIIGIVGTAPDADVARSRWTLRCS